MRLKTAIYILETAYAALLLIGFVGLVGSFFILKDSSLIIAIVTALALIILAFFFKLNFINFYLKRCKYPYEFLSVLEQLEMTKDLQISWNDDLINGPDKSQMLTQQFLTDNNLATEIGKKKINLPITFIVAILSLGGLFYFSQNVAFKTKPVLFIGLIFMFITNIYLWTKGKKKQNDNEPILSFTENGLSLNDNLYQWNKIKSWEAKGQSKNSRGEIDIIYSDKDENENKIVADLNSINIDRIDFMLLLTHFKAKYSG